MVSGSNKAHLMGVEVFSWNSSLEETITIGLWSVMSGLCQYGELHHEASEMWMKFMQEEEIARFIILCVCGNRGVCSLPFCNCSCDAIMENNLKYTGVICCLK